MLSFVAPSAGAVGVPSLKEAIARAEYEPRNGALGLQAPNRAQDYRTLFGEDGIHVVARENSQTTLLNLSLVRFGRAGSALTAVDAGVVSHEGHRVEITRPELVEWYENSAAGLEQGFTVKKRPVGDRQLVFESKLSGARVHGSAKRLTIRSEAGRRFGLSNLWVVDAAGKELPSSFEGTASGYRILVDDRGAKYPIVIDPLLTSVVDAEFESNQQNSFFGTTLAGVGDLNGDGFGDIAVGAPNFDAGESDEGAVFVFLGAAPVPDDGNPVNAHALIQGNQAAAFMGSGVAAAGDVNGDGYDDLLISAFRFDNGHNDEGTALVYHGGPGGIADGDPSTADGRVEADQATAFLGTGGSSARPGGIAGAGDVNGDGYADIIVGARLYDNPEIGEGVALIYHGSANGIGFRNPNGADALIESNLTGFPAPSLGTVAGAGDVNADGYADVIVGAEFYPLGGSQFGAAFVFHGSATGVGNRDPSTADATIESFDTHSGFLAREMSISSAGDVNGDGFADILVGFEKSDPLAIADGGRVLVLHGSPTGIPDANPTNSAAVLTLGQFGARLGSSVASVGDVDGDGYGDILVGAAGFDGTQTDEGAAYLFRGSASGIAGGDVRATADLEIAFGQAGAFVGQAVAGAGDVNGDGYDDVLVGARAFDNPQTNEGVVFLWLGGADVLASGNSTSAAAVLEADSEFAFLGTSVDGAGDINGDGHRDVILGAPGFDSGEAGEGAAFVFLGSASGFADGGLSEVHALLQGNLAGIEFGTSVAGAGDVNGDGYDDVVIGAPAYPATSNPTLTDGAVFVFHGSAFGIADGGPSTAATTITDNFGGPNSRFGQSVAGAGDVNGDGYSDIVAGATKSVGRVYVFAGSASGVPSGVSSSSATLDSVSGSEIGEDFGFDVASAGDINGDGYSDIIVGAPLFDGFSIDADIGRAILYYGGPAGSGLTSGGILEGGGFGVATGQLGYSVAGAGDVNGDGYDDVIVGAPEWPPNGSGEAFVLFGSAASIPSVLVDTAVDLRLRGDSEFSGFGSAVASAGDVNRDGYADVVVGAPEFNFGFATTGGAFVFHGRDELGVVLTAADADAEFKAASAAFSTDFGRDVAGVGDVDGDGFDDVLIGAPSVFLNGLFQVGQAYIFESDGEIRLPKPRPSQRRGDGSGEVVPALGRSESNDSFEVRLTARSSPRGLERGKLEVEACPAGLPFGDGGCTLHRSSTWIELDPSPAGVQFAETITGLTADVLYHWRARVIYASFFIDSPGVASPVSPRGGPWFRITSPSRGGDIRIVPEPGFGAVLLGAAALAGWGRRRHRGRRGGFSCCGTGPSRLDRRRS